MKGKLKFTLTALMSIAVIAYLTFSVYPTYNFTDNFLNYFIDATTDNLEDRIEIAVPGESALKLERVIGSLIEPTEKKSEMALTTVSAVNSIFSVMSTIDEQVATLKSYIIHQNPKVSELTALQEASAFLHYSIKYDVPLDLAVAVANTESHFNPDARSSHGSAGVMQVTWRVHSALLQSNGIMHEEELYDPEKGIAAGCLLISRYLRAYDSPKEAMGRYYGGSASVYWNRLSRNMSKLNSFVR